MAECLWLWLGGWWGCKGRLGFGGRCSIGEEVDLFGDGTTEIIERFADVGRVVVSFTGVLRPGRGLMLALVHK